MRIPRSIPSLRITGRSLIISAVFAALAAISVSAHPLGNFTINHFTRIEVADGELRVRYVVDMAEIPTFQESQTIDTDRDGKLSEAELNAYLEPRLSGYAERLALIVDGSHIPLTVRDRKLALPPGAGGLPTMRLELDLTGALEGIDSHASHRVLFSNRDQADRQGWNEIVVMPAAGFSIYDSNAFGSPATDELKTYPEDKLAAPLAERSAEFSFVRGAVPAGSAVQANRDGRPTVAASRDRLAELVSANELTPLVLLFGLLLAVGLGAVHALSPGHGKAVVGAYLVGSKGTPKHALFLGLTVTVTHTLGVFALGLITLFAARYIMPEKLFPWLSLISGAVVLTMGLTLFIRRVRSAMAGANTHEHHHHGELTEHDVADGQAHSHPHHEHSHDGGLTHSHGGTTHTHLPPGADGSPVTWKSLLALGISGGLLPCPSALVVMLLAISLGRVGYGLVLIVAFSFGLAATLTGVGLAFIYVSRWLKRSVASKPIFRLLPIASAFVIATVGAVLSYQALQQVGIDLRQTIAAFFAITPSSQTGSLTAFSLLAFGFILGLKHATEADHVAAVSTIVSEQRSVVWSSLIGGLWGLGHSIALMVFGLLVIVFQVKFGERLGLALEMGVGLMLIVLGINALRKIWQARAFHFHLHSHGGRRHAHPHLHGPGEEARPHTHHGLRLGIRPLVIGLVHGLAGSAALMLLVLSTITSPWVGIGYIAIFGVGSIGGMMMMSALVSLPVYFTAGRFARANSVVRVLAGAFSLGMGILITYQIGFQEGLFR